MELNHVDMFLVHFYHLSTYLWIRHVATVGLPFLSTLHPRLFSLEPRVPDHFLYGAICQFASFFMTFQSSWVPLYSVNETKYALSDKCR